MNLLSKNSPNQNNEDKNNHILSTKASTKKTLSLSIKQQILALKSKYQSSKKNQIIIISGICMALVIILAVGIGVGLKYGLNGGNDNGNNGDNTPNSNSHDLAKNYNVAKKNLASLFTTASVGDLYNAATANGDTNVNIDSGAFYLYGKGVKAQINGETFSTIPLATTLLSNKASNTDSTKNLPPGFTAIVSPSESSQFGISNLIANPAFKYTTTNDKVKIFANFYTYVDANGNNQYFYQFNLMCTMIQLPKAPNAANPSAPVATSQLTGRNRNSIDENAINVFFAVDIFEPTNGGKTPGDSKVLGPAKYQPKINAANVVKTQDNFFYDWKDAQISELNAMYYDKNSNNYSVKSSLNNPFWCSIFQSRNENQYPTTRADFFKKLGSQYGRQFFNIYKNDLDVMKYPTPFSTYHPYIDWQTPVPPSPADQPTYYKDAFNYLDVDPSDKPAATQFRLFLFNNGNTATHIPGTSTKNKDGNTPIPFQQFDDNTLPPSAASSSNVFESNTSPSLVADSSMMVTKLPSFGPNYSSVSASDSIEFRLTYNFIAPFSYSKIAPQLFFMGQQIFALASVSNIAGSTSFIDSKFVVTYNNLSHYYLNTKNGHTKGEINKDPTTKEILKHYGKLYDPATANKDIDNINYSLPASDVGSTNLPTETQLRATSFVLNKLTQLNNWDDPIRVLLGPWSVDQASSSRILITDINMLKASTTTKFAPSQNDWAGVQWKKIADAKDEKNSWALTWQQRIAIYQGGGSQQENVQTRFDDMYGTMKMVVYNDSKGNLCLKPTVVDNGSWGNTFMYKYWKLNQFEQKTP